MKKGCKFSPDSWFDSLFSLSKGSEFFWQTHKSSASSRQNIFFFLEKIIIYKTQLLFAYGKKVLLAYRNSARLISCVSVARHFFGVVDIE